MKKIFILLLNILLLSFYCRIEGNIVRNHVYIIFSPNCPICQKNINYINELNTKYQKDSILFSLVIPKNIELTKKEYRKLKKEYHITYEIINDKYNDIINTLHASITPEAFLVDTSNRIIYQGLITDQFIQIGQKQAQIQHYYLEDAINAYINHLPFQISKTQAVGCYIENE